MHQVVARAQWDMDRIRLSSEDQADRLNEATTAADAALDRTNNVLYGILDEEPHCEVQPITREELLREARKLVNQEPSHEAWYAIKRSPDGEHQAMTCWIQKYREQPLADITPAYAPVRKGTKITGEPLPF